MSDNVAIRVERRRDLGVVAVLEAGLDAGAPERRREAQPPIVVVAQAGMELIGGLAADIVGDWLHVELLWVAESVRGQGIGSRLLREAEKAAVADGCRRAYLSTLAWQAPDFYRRHGYRPIAELPSFSGPHARTWFGKRLTDGSPAAPPSHRLRASALVFRDDRLLLVERHDRARGFRWWSPPGGGVLDGESFAGCAERETRQATGLPAHVGGLAYVLDLLDPVFNVRNAEFVFLAEIEGGGKTGEPANVNLPEGAGFRSRGEMEQLRVLPDILRATVWADRSAGFPSVRLLGPDPGERSRST